MFCKQCKYLDLSKSTFYTNKNCIKRSHNQWILSKRMIHIRISFFCWCVVGVVVVVFFTSVSFSFHIMLIDTKVNSVYSELMWATKWRTHTHKHIYKYRYNFVHKQNGICIQLNLNRILTLFKLIKWNQFYRKWCIFVEWQWKLNSWKSNCKYIV